MNREVQDANPDVELAARFMASPTEHQEAFACRCTELLRRYVYRMVFVEGRGPRSTHKATFAEDAYSLALLKFGKALRQLKCATDLHSWLGKIARSAVMDEVTDRIRRTKIRVHFNSLDELIARAAEEPGAARELNDLEVSMATYQSCHWRDPETVAIQNERLAILGSIFTKHSAESTKGTECGVIVGLIYEQEMTVQQIAGTLDRPKSTIHDIVHRNMTAYRDMYMRMIERNPLSRPE